ncbi:MAG: NAD-dependent epimerase/dehydratase family protein [Reyranella sp.]|nr:NAD-dependent epimerase/dehydratase family protein [Reyranella sp.]
MVERDVVVITGSSGFIGSALINKLAGHFALVGFDRMASHAPPPAAECVCIDLSSEEGVKGAFERIRIAYGNRIASVIHLAAYYDLSGEPSPLYEQITVRGTERLLRHLQEFQVEQFVFTSTMLVHAPVALGQRINEDSPIDPRWPYPLSKVETEALIRQQHGDIPVVLLRLAGVYDDKCRNAFLSQQIVRIHERELLSHVYPGDIRRGQAFVHLDDVGEALIRIIAMRKELPPEMPLLVGEPETLSYDKIQRTVGRLLYGQEWETRQVPKTLARTGAWIEGEILQEEPFIKPWMVDFADDHYELDVTRARTLLSWEPKHALLASLPVIVDALKSDPTGWYRDNKLNSALVAGETASHAPKEDAAGSHESADQVLAHRRMMREHEEMMLAEHRQTIWAHFANIALGTWLATSPLVFGLFDPASVSEAALRVTMERGLPPPEWRNWALGWSDIGAGSLIILFGLLSLSRRMNWAQWANTLVGLWLLFAPLVFWAPNASTYANDTLIGALVITFAVLVPMMPGMSMEGMMGGPDIPPGWSYCPSTWAQRLPMILMGLVGFLIARYLAAYQMGHVASVWDPFFVGTDGRNGTETIITSAVSKAWPIPDGGLGAVAYMLEILMGAMGDKRRWRTMPWMVTFFGILVVPLGVISIYFIIIQPIVIGTWCALCLLAALAMLVMIPFALDELVAMGQFLLWSRRARKSLLRMFFMGGALEGGTEDKGVDLDSTGSALAAMMAGVTLPWTLVASVVLGIWLMFSRLALGTVPPMANSDHLVGALVVTTAVIAMAEVVRPLRFVNVLFGGWLVLAAWFLEGASPIAHWSNVAVGISLIALSLPRGVRSQHHYAGWDRFVV